MALSENERKAIAEQSDYKFGDVQRDGQANDPSLQEYNIFDGTASMVHYTGYLDQRPRLEFAGAEASQLLGNLPPGRLALCLVGGGHDGAGAVAERSSSLACRRRPTGRADLACKRGQPVPGG